jgi:hypothetical protein
MIRDEIVEGKQKKNENYDAPPYKRVVRGGCVTNWYQSMVTALGLFGLMDELHKNHIKGV